MKRNLMSKILPIPAGLGIALLSFSASADVGMDELFAAWNQSEGTQVQSEASETRPQVAEREGAAGSLFQRLSLRSDLFDFSQPSGGVWGNE